MKKSDPSRLTELHYEVLNPQGYMPDVTLASLAERPESLSGKVIYIINSWPVGSGSVLHQILSKIGDFSEGRVPGSDDRDEGEAFPVPYG